MKKLFLSFLILITSINLLSMAPMQNTPVRYQPATGPLNLSDTSMASRGIIMQTVMNNTPALANVNPKLAAANHAIEQFDGKGQNFRYYQDIMANLKQAVNTREALDAIAAFETIIMHLYDYRAYFLGSYRPNTSIFFTGLRWSLLNPLSYFSPKSWISDNNAEMKQLIDELYNLADIAAIHSAITGARIRAIANSYRYWRQCLAIGCMVYLTADACTQGFDQSIIKTLSKGGIINGFTKTGKNIISDTKKASKALYKSTYWLAEHGWNDIIKPTGTMMLFGTDGLKKTIYNTSQKQNKNLKPRESNININYIKAAWMDHLKKFNLTNA